MTTRILPIPMGSGVNPQDYYTKEEVNALIADFITNTVDDLTNYYLKTDTYTQTEINNLIGQITSFEVVATLPQSDIKTNVIYLLGPIGSGSDRYEEWIYSNSTWVKIGETSIDLSNYVTVNTLNTALSFYTTTFDLNLLLQGKQDTLTAGDGITIGTDGTISADSQIVSLTQQEYDALGTNVDPDVVYVITDASPVVLATVATTGDYDDLINKPTIPVVPTLATVATSGSYNDLTDKPVIPDAVSGTNDGTNWTSLTIGTDTYDIPQGGGGDTEEIEQAIAAAINDTRDTINQDLHNNYVKTEALNDQLKNYTPKAALDNYATNGYVDTAIGSVYAEIEDKEKATSFALNDLEENKQDALTAGAGITIGTDGTISADIPTVGTGVITLTSNGDTIGTFGLNDTDDKTIEIPAGGGSSSNAWYGSQYQFDTLGTYDPDTDYYISDRIDYSEIKGKPNLDAFETKADSQAADQALDAKIAGKENSIVFLGTAGLPSIGTPLEGVTYAIEGETVALTFTLANLSTVTYNFVID